MALNASILPGVEAGLVPSILQRMSVPMFMHSPTSTLTLIYTPMYTYLLGVETGSFPSTSAAMMACGSSTTATTPSSSPPRLAGGV